MFPASMLSKLFVKGSLKNNENGFEMKIKNIIDSGTLVGMGPLVVDETTYEPAQVRIKVGEAEMTGDQLSRTRPLSVRAFAEVRVLVTSDPLPAGEHKLTIQMTVNEAGKIKVNVTEPLAE